MSGGDKILNQIKLDCDKRIQAIKAKSQADIAETLKQSEQDADKAQQEILEKAKIKVQHINAVAQSRSELEVRNTLLKKRRSEIDLTMQKTLEFLLSLNDKEYFEIIYALADSLSVKSGEFIFNKKDLDRLPSDFKRKMKHLGMSVTVSENTADICGGFILKNGDIEENMGFSAILSDKKDEIEDLINRELFVK